MQTWQKLKHNPNLWKTFFIREKIIQAIRSFFQKEKYHEVETPLLLSSVIPESYLEVFETYLLDQKHKRKRMFLPTSPEVSLKKLLVAGIGNCFEITKSFRNTETDSNTHQPEFTILEWYRIGATYKEVMRDCEKLISFIYNAVLGREADGYLLSYLNQTIDLSPPWERQSISEVFQKYAGITFDSIIGTNQSFSTANIASIAKKKGYQVTATNTWEEIFNQIYLNEIAPFLGTQGKPTIIYDYPSPLMAMSRLKATDPRIAERFEVYIGGLELADGCTELIDWQEQKKRFTQEMKIINKKHKTHVIADNDFLTALKTGLPLCSGVALGVDRLTMLFTNSSTIEEVILFPT